MSRKGAYLGGSSVVQLGSVGGPERPKQTEDRVSVAFPRAGGAEITVPKTQSPAKPRMAHPTFKKFRRRVNDVVSWLPHLGIEHQQTARTLARIHRRVEQIAASEYGADAASDAAEASKKFYRLITKIGDAAIARAKLAAREAKRIAKKVDGI